MEKEEFEHDWYGILGLNAPSPIDDVIRAARKLAIKFHPDKTTDPDAPAKFLLIQKAKDILSDENRKKLIDEHALTRKKRQDYENLRNNEMDKNRKRFRDELERRVEAASADLFQDSGEVLEREIRKKSRVLESLRRENAEWLATTGQATEKAQKVSEDVGILKVQWRKSTPFSDSNLQQLFGPFGLINEIIILDSNSAIVIFVDKSAAVAAENSFAKSKEFVVTIQKQKEFPTYHYKPSGLSDNLSKADDSFDLFSFFMTEEKNFQEKERIILEKLNSLAKSRQEPVIS
jgi:curved DNA-binding protein CbpA